MDRKILNWILLILILACLASLLFAWMNLQEGGENGYQRYIEAAARFEELWDTAGEMSGVEIKRQDNEEEIQVEDWQDVALDDIFKLETKSGQGDIYGTEAGDEIMGPKKPADRFVVLAISSYGSERRAILHDSEVGFSSIVREGQDYAGFLVGQISASGVNLLLEEENIFLPFSK